MAQSYLGSLGDVFAAGRVVPPPSGPVLSLGQISTLRQAGDYARAAYAACLRYAVDYGAGSDAELGMGADLYSEVVDEVGSYQANPPDALIQVRAMLTDADGFVDAFRVRRGIPAPGASGGGPGYVTGGASGTGPVAVAASSGGIVGAVLAFIGAMWALGGKKKRK